MSTLTPYNPLINILVFSEPLIRYQRAGIISHLLTDDRSLPIQSAAALQRRSLGETRLPVADWMSVDVLWMAIYSLGISAGLLSPDMIAAKSRVAELIGCSIFGLAGSEASIVASMPGETGRTASECTRLKAYTLYWSPSTN